MASALARETPKDGPSAGAAIAVALVSLWKGKPVYKNIAVTGELTLSGRILPVGGLKEKVLAAKRAGIKTVIMPAMNRVDIDSLPVEVKEGLVVKLAENMEEIIKEVLEETSE